MKLEMQRVKSVGGPIALVAHEGRIVGICFEDHVGALQRSLERRFGPVELERAIVDPGRALARYLGGAHASLDELPLDPGGTEAQRRVWEALRRIPAGALRTYGAIAHELGTSPRAVGAACAANPIALAIPCHRVVGSRSALTGYAGGIERKRWLLAHEGAQLVA